MDTFITYIGMGAGLVCGVVGGVIVLCFVAGLIGVIFG